jgi:hypothetical protein
VGFIQHLRCGRGAADEPQSHGLACIEDAADEQQIEGAVAADDARQVGVVDGGQQPDLHLRVAEAGIVGGNQHVAGDGDRHAATAHGTADGRDRRLGQAGLQSEQLRVQPAHAGMHFGG